MAEPTLLGDIIQPAWLALTGEQRTCWHFWAAAHPRVTTNGKLQVLYGQQTHYQINAPIAVLETEPQLEDPPATSTKPTVPAVTGIAWPLTARIENTTTSPAGYAAVYIEHALPSDVALLITQGYTRQRNKPQRVTGNRHVKAVPPGTSGAIDLEAPNGYFATTGGATSWAVIKGKTARRRPDLPLARMKVINLNNGVVVSTTIANPNGGAPKTIRRPKHVDP